MQLVVGPISKRSEARLIVYVDRLRLKDLLGQRRIGGVKVGANIAQQVLTEMLMRHYGLKR
jgi:hypothetical protein